MLATVGHDKQVTPHLAVTRIQGNAHLESLVLHLAHASEGGRVEWRHVVVTQLLPASRECTHHGTPGELQVRPFVIRLTRNQEELLLQPNHGLHCLRLETKQTEETSTRLRHCLHRTQKRRLLVERLPVERDENSWDVQSVIADEHW